MCEISLKGYSLEKFKKGWVIVKEESDFGRPGYLAFGDEDGEDDMYEWINERVNNTCWKTQYFDTQFKAADKLKKLLEEWNEEKKEFEEKPSCIIKL